MGVDQLSPTIIIAPAKEKEQFKPPWTVVDFPKDEFGFQNKGYVLNVMVPADHESIVFMDSRNSFSEVAPGFENVPKDYDGIIGYVQNKLGIHVSDELTEKTKIWGSYKRGVIEAMTAASVYDSDGSIKNSDDNEASALLFVALACSTTHPTIAEQCFNELLERRRFLPPFTRETDIDLSEMHLGEIPIDKIYTTHVTNFLPEIDGESAVILPRIDSDRQPRTTVHTFINGMVESHSLAGGLDKTSWDEAKYMIGSKFKDDVAENGLPENFFKADTFWSFEPGIGMTVPKGSFMIVPTEEVASMEKYKNLGIEIIGYDRTTESLSQVSERLLNERQVPFMKNIHPDPESYDMEDENLAEKLGVPAVNHFNLRRMYDSEKLMFNSLDVISEGLKFTEDGNGKIPREEAGRIALRSKHQMWTEWKPKKTGLAMALSYVRDTIVEEWENGKLPVEFLLTAYITKLI